MGAATLEASLPPHAAIRHRCHRSLLQVIEPGFVATDMVVHNPHLLPERMIRPEDVAEAALLPLRLGPNATPLEVTLKVTQSPYKTNA